MAPESCQKSEMNDIFMRRKILRSIDSDQAVCHKALFKALDLPTDIINDPNGMVFRGLLFRNRSSAGDCYFTMREIRVNPCIYEISGAFTRTELRSDAIVKDVRCNERDKQLKGASMIDEFEKKRERGQEAFEQAQDSQAGDTSERVQYESGKQGQEGHQKASASRSPLAHGKANDQAERMADKVIAERMEAQLLEEVIRTQKALEVPKLGIRPIQE